MLLKGENIICIANTSWFGNYAKSTVQIMERLAKNNRVLFVEYPYTIKDVFATWRHKQSAPVKRMLGFDKRLQIIESPVGSSAYNLVIPPGIPVFFLKNEFLFRLLFPINVFIYWLTVRWAIRKLNFSNPIVVTAYNPIYGLYLLRKFNEKKHVYYCYDGVESVFFGQRIFDIERRFCQQVDAIITTSDFLNSKKKLLNSHCNVVKNGVDFPLFQRFAKHNVFQRTCKKVGFIGSLDPRFDIDTMEYVVAKMPDFDFHFTGDMRNVALKSRLAKFVNVQFFDPIKPNDVPPLLATYDVGIIPYIVNEVNKNIYPLKINEYLSVGVPVVMTAFAILPEFDTMVSIATNKDEFVAQLRAETKYDNTVKIKQRIEFAASNSWDARTEQFGDLLN
ncbi:MAG: hypothetical protein AUK44_09595 [Porphyromonadaceae bacterium CG2_30_38_12]|nr:MAG: hypothetical protein AUK44_09595 [Porphyromonadaceae bacterium CG2_30_38_12]